MGYLGDMNFKESRHHDLPRVLLLFLVFHLGNLVFCSYDDYSRDGGPADLDLCFAAIFTPQTQQPDGEE